MFVGKHLPKKKQKPTNFVGVWSLLGIKWSPSYAQPPEAFFLKKWEGRENWRKALWTRLRFAAQFVSQNLIW